jgi:hypothetical protein
MLGEQVGEEQGKVTGLRVLPPEGNNPVVEVSFQAKGTLLGFNVTSMGTYQSISRDGIFYGEGHGVVMTEDGDTANWKGQGIGKPTGHGQSVNWRGSLFFQTTSSKFSKLNSTPLVFEYDIDEEGNSRTKTWEWK